MTLRRRAGLLAVAFGLVLAASAAWPDEPGDGRLSAAVVLLAGAALSAAVAAFGRDPGLSW